MSDRTKIGAWNEWGRLREAVLGQVDDLIEPKYIPALIRVSEEGKKGLREKAGIAVAAGFPELARKMRDTIDTLQRVLTEHGVTVS
jgi:hypothetical protein